MSNVNDINRQSAKQELVRRLGPRAGAQPHSRPAKRVKATGRDRYKK